MRPARLVGHNADIPILPCKLRMPKFKAEKIRRGKQREKDIFQRSIIKGNFVWEDAEYFNVEVHFRLV